MRYKVIEHLTHVNSVVVNADNKEQAWEKAMEGGLMSESGKLDDMYVNKFEVVEVSVSKRIEPLMTLSNHNDVMYYGGSVSPIDSHVALVCDDTDEVLSVVDKDFDDMYVNKFEVVEVSDE